MKGNLLAAVRSCLAAALVLAAAALPARAERFMDGAGLVGDGAKTEIESRLEKMSAEYGLDVRIVTVDDWSEFGSGIHGASENLYKGLEMSEDGLLFLMAMGDRSYDLFAHGKRGESAFSHDARDEMVEAFGDNFKRNDWEGGFRDSLSSAESELSTWKFWGERDAGSRRLILIVSAIALVGSVFIVYSRYKKEKAKLCNVAFADKADSYMNGDVKFTVKDDRFTHTTTRTIVHESRSSSGGSRSSGGGGSHHSGHF